MSDIKEKAPSILVADDSSSARSMIVNRLTGLGYTVHQASDGKEAYQQFLVLAQDLDLILMDANMPVVDGFRACSEIKRHPNGQNIRIIMVTGQGDDASVDKAFASGAGEFITKPIHWAVLEKRIQLSIERGRAQHALRESSARMEAIFSTVADGILVVDANGNIETLNQSAARIFGYSERELKGQMISMLSPTDVEEYQAQFFQSYQSEGLDSSRPGSVTC